MGRNMDSRTMERHPPGCERTVGKCLNMHFQGNDQLAHEKIDPYQAGISETRIQITARTEPHIRWGCSREGPAIAGQKPSAEDELGLLEFLCLQENFNHSPLTGAREAEPFWPRNLTSKS